MLDKDLFPETPFWEYSLEVYGKQDVPQTCLRLQGNLQVDVNILLFCCWIAEAGYAAVADQAMVELISGVRDFHEQVVKNLRVARSVLKGGYSGLPDELSAGLRKNILSIEVDCEHGEQILLVRKTAILGTPSGIADMGIGAENLKSYLRCLKAKPEKKDWDDLAFLLERGVSGVRGKALLLLAPQDV